MTVTPLGGIPQTGFLYGLRNAKLPSGGNYRCAGGIRSTAPPNVSGGNM
jgi:hypothetical protein